MTTTSSLAAQTIIDSAKLGLFLGAKLAEDIPDNQFARFITNNGSPVVANHPAYAFGHLAIYPPKVAGFLGGDATKLAVPETWASIFEQDLECHDDAEGSIYPGKDEIMSAYQSGFAGVIEIVASTDEAVFAQENPNEKIRDRFPTLGMMCSFMLTSHVMFHLGQVSTWRRCMGLGSAM